MLEDKKSCCLEDSFIKKNKFLLLFLFIYLILSLLLFDPKLSTGGDNAVYIILAESIITGKGYKNIHIPWEPEHTQYPFGFPLMLSLPLLIFGSNIIVLKLFIILSGLGSLYFVYRIGDYLFKEKINIIVPFCLSIPVFITYNHRINSEIPFLFFSLGALYFFLKAQGNSKFSYYISFIFATYACFIRTAGITLIIAIMFYLVLKKQYKYFIIFLVFFLAFFIPWQIRNLSIPHEGGYIDQLLAKDPYYPEEGRVGFFDLAQRGSRNFLLYFSLGLPKTLLPLMRSPWIGVPMGIVFLLLTVTGFVKRGKKFSVTEYYFIFALLLMLGWPTVWTSERFLLPILPFFIFYIYIGLYWLNQKIKFMYFIPAVTGIFITVNLLRIIPDVREGFADNMTYLKGDRFAGYPRDWKHYFVVIHWIKDNVPEEKIIMARKPEFVYLLTKNKSFTYPLTTDHNEIVDAIRRCDYVIVDNFFWHRQTKRFLLPVIVSEPQMFRPVIQTEDPQFTLLLVKK